MENIGDRNKSARVNARSEAAEVDGSEDTGFDWGEDIGVAGSNGSRVAGSEDIGVDGSNDSSRVAGSKDSKTWVASEMEEVGVGHDGEEDDAPHIDIGKLG